MWGAGSPSTAGGDHAQLASRHLEPEGGGNGRPGHRPRARHIIARVCVKMCIPKATKA